MYLCGGEFQWHNKISTIFALHDASVVAYVYESCTKPKPVPVPLDACKSHPVNILQDRLFSPDLTRGLQPIFLYGIQYIAAPYESMDMPGHNRTITTPDAGTSGTFTLRSL